MLKVFFLVPVKGLVLIFILELVIDILLNPKLCVFGVVLPTFKVELKFP
jgi:hypothetical protein